VEVINRQVMVCDRQIQNNWSEIQNIGTLQFIINQHVSTETSTSAFSLTFGELDEIYMRLPDNKDLNTAGDDYVSLLRANLELTTPYKGPYVVLSHYKNDITCKHANVDPRMSISALYS
jgi:hypothetical protein